MQRIHDPSQSNVDNIIIYDVKLAVISGGGGKKEYL